MADLPRPADFVHDWPPGSLTRLLVLERVQDPGNLVRRSCLSLPPQPRPEDSAELLLAADSLLSSACWAGQPAAHCPCTGMARVLPAARRASWQASGTLHRCSSADVRGCAGCCDPWNDKALKASRGRHLCFPLAQGSWEQLLAVLHAQDLQGLAAAVPAPGSEAGEEQMLLSLLSYKLPRAHVHGTCRSSPGRQRHCLGAGHRGQGPVAAGAELFPAHLHTHAGRCMPECGACGGGVDGCVEPWSGHLHVAAASAKTGTLSKAWE